MPGTCAFVSIFLQWFYFAMRQKIGVVKGGEAMQRYFREQNNVALCKLPSLKSTAQHYLYEQEHNFSAFQQLQASLSGEGTTNLAEVCQAAAVHEPLREACNCGN